MPLHCCTTIFCCLVVFIVAATDDQDTNGRKPLQRGPDATTFAGLSVMSSQDVSASRAARPDATAHPLVAAQQGSDARLNGASAPNSAVRLQLVHTDVMPSEVLGWPPKQAALGPSTSPNSTEPGANGASDYVPAPPSNSIQVPGSHAEDTSASDLPADIVTAPDGYSTFTPRNNSLNGTAFQLFWTDSMRNPQILGARLPRNTYWVTPGSANSIKPASADEQSYHLTLDCLGRALPFVLDFQGSALVLKDGSKGGVAFKNCSRLTVRGVTMSYPPSQFQHTQGAVVDVGRPPVCTLTVQAHEGYPAHLWADARMCAAYTAGTQVIRVNTSDIIPSSVQRIDDSHAQLQTSYDLYNIQPGDLMACHTGIGGHGLYWERCADCLLTDTIFHNPAGHWIAEVACRNMTYAGNHLAPYPSTVGAQSELPLMSSVGHGISVHGARSGPTIVGNTMRGMGGDGIAVATVLYAITAAEAHQSTITVACSGATCSGIRQGDAVIAGSAPSEPLPGSAKVVNVRAWGLAAAANDSAQGQAVQADTLLQVLLGNWPDSWTTGSPTVLMVTPGGTAGGPRFQIRRNSIANNRGSGIVLQAPGGVVANNMITNPKYWGIQALPSIEGCANGAFTADLVLANNTIDAVFGGIAVGCLEASTQLPCRARGHSNLTVTGNLVQDAAMLPLLLTSARGVSVASNVFKSVLCYPWVLYNGYPWLPRFWQSVGFVAEAADVTFKDNTIDTSAHCAYGNLHNPFEALSGTVTNLTIA